jgi:hypothetical protein
MPPCLSKPTHDTAKKSDKTKMATKLSAPLTDIPHTTMASSFSEVTNFANKNKAISTSPMMTSTHSSGVLIIPKGIQKFSF